MLRFIANLHKYVNARACWLPLREKRSEIGCVGQQRQQRRQQRLSRISVDNPTFTALPAPYLREALTDGDSYRRARLRRTRNRRSISEESEERRERSLSLSIQGEPLTFQTTKVYEIPRKLEGPRWTTSA